MMILNLLAIMNLDLQQHYQCDNEFGSTTALPIWVDYMNSAFKKIDIDEFTLPDGISYVRINKKTGELSKSAEDESYFELFLSEDL